MARLRVVTYSAPSGLVLNRLGAGELELAAAVQYILRCGLRGVRHCRSARWLSEAVQLNKQGQLGVLGNPTAMILHSSSLLLTYKALGASGRCQALRDSQTAMRYIGPSRHFASWPHRRG